MVLRIMLVDKSPEQGADTVASPKEIEEARSLLRDRPEEPQSIHQSPWRRKETTTEKSKRIPTINLCGFPFHRDLCAGCYAVCINGAIVFAFESVSRPVSSLNSKII